MADDPLGKVVKIPDGVIVEHGTFFAESAKEMLIADREDLDLADLKITSVEEFLADVANEEKTFIVEQAILLCEKLYPHLRSRSSSSNR
ncbi:MAG: hypothetical protein JWP63_2821 [Candidatus Solibacter sp.]|nr:hypothetical protein [Candidatus Solibacter sp.]